MIQHPLLIILILILIEIAVLYAKKNIFLNKIFIFLPFVFWIYFLPMLASTFGLIDSTSFILKDIPMYFLPMGLSLLLVCVDIKAIFRLGFKALMMFCIGSLGIACGAVFVTVILKNIINPQFGLAFASLVGSWTGGSTNMIAVKEALSVSDNVFLPMVIVDTVCPYVWMGILIAAVRLQPFFDRWNRVDTTVIDELRQQTLNQQEMTSKPFIWKHVLMTIVFAVGMSFLSRWIAGQLPEIKGVVSTYAWTIMVVSAFSIGLSFTPVRRLEMMGANKIGYVLLFFVLTSIGARASLSNMGTSLILILAGGLIIIVQVIFLLIGARILKAPLFLVATASQANIGGPASAPVVAAVYEPSLASVGLLLAVFGNIVGTYWGILTGYVLNRWIL